MGRAKGSTSATKKRASPDGQVDSGPPATRLRTPSTSGRNPNPTSITKSRPSSRHGGNIGVFFRPKNQSTHSFTSEASRSSNSSVSTSFATVSSDATTIDDFEADNSCKETGLDSNDAAPILSLSPLTCEERLKNIWPRFPCHTFSEAPLAVQWEICRIALHCGVELSTCDIQYDSHSKWDTQASLRQQLTGLWQFKDKELPAMVDSATWKLALSTSQTRDNAIRFSGELVINPDGKALFSLKLEPLKLECSYRLQRRFGADRFLEIVMPSPSTFTGRALPKGNDIKDTIIRWLVEKKHYFLSRQWGSFFYRAVKSSAKMHNGKKAKRPQKDTLYFFACNGDAFTSPRKQHLPPCEHATKLNVRVNMPVHELIEWAIGFSNASGQLIFKLFSRISLSMTDTRPTVILGRHQIIERDSDLGRKQPMNDGVGQMSKSLAKEIATQLGLPEVPSAFQGRIGCAKGMWVVDVNEDSGSFWIETYPSQRKWECDHIDSHHRTFEVKDWSKEPKQAALNQQFIPVLELQAIDPQAMRAAFKKHLVNSLSEDIAALRDAMNHPPDLRLLMQGLPSRSDKTVLGHTPFLASLPKDTPDAIKFLLDAGFDQTKLQYLQGICLDVSKRNAEVLGEKFSIRVPCSAYLFMVADFSGTLKPNEVHVSFSSKFQCDEFCDTLLENMDIVVARSPTHLPTDVQRVKAVSKRELRHLKDVIVFSTQGDSSPADLLSGGDYDGDRAWVCWDQSIVQNFRNARIVTDSSDPLKLGLLRRSERILGEIQREESNLQDVTSQFLYEAFCFNMRPSLLGICTNYKESYSYWHGYHGDKVVALSRLLGYLVDQSKQGFLFDDSDWRKFCIEFLERKGTYLTTPRYKDDSHPQVVTRSGRAHILDYLKDVTRTTIDETLGRLQTALHKGPAQSYDEDLTIFYRHMDEKHGSNTDWKKIEKQLIKDVDEVAALWSKLTSQSMRIDAEDESYPKAVEKVYQKWQSIQPTPRQQPTVLAQMLMCDWMKDKEASQWALLKASLAFRRHHVRESFIWRIAGRQLAILKTYANPVDGSAPSIIVPSMAAGMRIAKKFVDQRRALRKAQQMKDDAMGLLYLHEDDFDDFDYF